MDCLKSPEYKIYWLVRGPHCDKAVKVKQVDGKIAYVCRHDLTPNSAPPQGIV